MTPSPEPAGDPTRRLNLPYLCYVVACLGLPLFLFANPEFWPWFLGPLHYEPPLYPFLDMHGRLAQFQMSALGWDVYELPNPLDPMHRINNKPSITLVLGELGLKTDHLAAASIAAISLFFVACFSLTRPDRWTDCTVAVLATISPPVLLLIERANDDILVFILLAPIPWLLTRGKLTGNAATTAILALATAVKFYPAAVFSLFLHEPRRRYRGAIFFVTGIVFILVYLIANREEIAFLKDRVPSPEGFYVFGASELMRMAGLGEFKTTASLGALGLVAMGAGWIFWKYKAVRTPGSGEVPARAFLMGAAMLVFCYFLNTNFDYRMAFFLFLLPYLQLLRRAETPGYRQIGWLLSLLILGSLYVEGLAIAAAYEGGTSWSGAYLPFAYHLKQITNFLCISLIVWVSARILGPSIWELITPPAGADAETSST